MEAVALERDVTPRVSVVIACYNYGHFLEQCVDSAFQQQEVDVDVTVVDDASTDGSATVAEHLQRTRGIRLVRHQANAGYIASYNEALALVDGDYVVKLDADDTLPAGALARSTMLMSAHPEVGFVYGRPFHFSGAGGQPPPRPVRSWTVWDGWDWLEKRCRSGYNCISNPEVTIRRSVLNRVGPFKPALTHTCDFELWMRLATQSAVGRVVGPYQGCYRVHPNSMQRTVNAGTLADLRGRLAAFDALFSAEVSPRGDRLLALAHQALAAQALDAACRAYDRGRVQPAEIAALVTLARSAHPETERLSQWRSLKRRERVGAQRAHLWPPFVTRALTRRAAEEWGHRRWKRTGL
jgi:GT2 family glycosyltransferase